MVSSVFPESCQINALKQTVASAFQMAKSLLTVQSHCSV